MDSLFFNQDGTIRKVIPTLRGVGITEATGKIQIDRYSKKSSRGVSIAFLDTLNRFEGWKTILEAGDAWIRYNSVDFGRKKLNSVIVKALTKTGGTLEIKLDNSKGPLIADINIPESNNWKIINTPLSGFKEGIHNLIVLLKNNKDIEIDWVKFK